MINIAKCKETLETIMKENNIYLSYIGIFDFNDNEIFSVQDNNYLLSFDVNYEHSYRIIEKIKEKIQQSKQGLGKLKFFSSFYDQFSYAVERHGDYLVLFIIKKDFSNLTFLIYLRKLLEKLITNKQLNQQLIFVQLTKLFKFKTNCKLWYISITIAKRDFGMIIIIAINQMIMTGCRIMNIQKIFSDYLEIKMKIKIKYVFQIQDVEHQLFSKIYIKKVITIWLEQIFVKQLLIK